MKISSEKFDDFQLENLTQEELILEVKKIIAEYHKQEFQIQKLQHELAQLKRMIYGSRSERFSAATDPQQITLDLGIESEAPKPPVTETITYQRKKTQQNPPVIHKRLPLPEHLERVVIVIEPKEDVTGLKAIGKEITETLDYKPGKLFVKRYERTKYVKPEDEEGNQQVLIGVLPSRPIEKGIPEPGLLAQIIIDKYVDHLPCYRQIQRYARVDGVKIPASTMSEWLRGACAYLEPLREVFIQKVLMQPYLHADETRIKVLDNSKKGDSLSKSKGKTHLGYYWVYHAPLGKMTLFEYRPGRGERDGPGELLKNFKGKLQTDAYVVYESLDNPDIIHFNCMAHARREFDEALNNDAARAGYALEQIQKLYAIERRAQVENLNHQQRYALRQKESMPILQEIHQWLTVNIEQTTDQSVIHKAIAYSLKRWDKLSYYASDGEANIDNNPVENAIRPVAVGRKNYLFAGSHDAAQRAALFYSLLNTCKLNDIEPWAWLKESLTKLHDYKANKLHELLPLKCNFPELQ